MNESLTEQEAELVASLLAKLKPGFLPLPIFHEVTRLTATPIIEIVPLRRNQEKVEVLLTRRPTDDPVWSNKLHTPGTVVRATDSLESAMERILSNELSDIATSRPTFVQNILHHSGRGMEASQIYWVEVTGNPTTGQFHDADNLPEDLVASQLDFIPAVVEAYRSQL